MRFGLPLCVLIMAGTILAMLTARSAAAQPQSADQKPTESYATLYLVNLTDVREGNDAVTDLRNMLPKAKIYRVGSANAISIYATPEDITKAQKILEDIDRPRKTYRLTYTISDGSPQGMPQRFVMIAGLGNKITLKHGSRVPIVTGIYGTGSDQSTQLQYMDVGINLDATLEGNGDEMRLRTKIEQTSVAEEKSNVGIQDPVIRQSVMEGESAIALGKPVLLGSMDTPGSGKRVEVSVIAEVIK